ncbi:MAG: hypothetical protein LKG38_03400 [Atopobiaceae bacterium]|nr:hypothetical protein [Atopobiaceae bacterium]MCH4120310.1 hypothetical protein [Atopobiaceae bacterium]MCI1318372.1 hypothetical protein [Atopobiaceae bacterium]MCI1432334.1 hypothetical protein [Atopobiaceae bacterium]MCI1470792.1 hypothetical protein [Atopobiaceae bacterium]
MRFALEYGATMCNHDPESPNQAMALVRCNGTISSIAVFPPTATFTVPAQL